MTDWRPLSERASPTGDCEALHDGVPAWLHDSLRGWLLRFYRRGNPQPGANYIYLLSEMREMARRTRHPLSGDDGVETWHSLQREIGRDESFFLDAVDFTLHKFSGMRADSLESMLSEAGSKWRVSTVGGGTHLERRLAAATTEAADSAISVADRAAIHLAKARQDAFGRSPDSSSAYREAVRAVEAIAKPIISPNNDRATLGSMIAVLRDAPQEFEVTIYAGEEGVKRLRATLELLWKGQHDRHGTDDVNTPIHVDQPAAEAAIHLAVTLVEWFRSGAITRNT